MFALPKESKLASVNANAVPKLYSKMTRAARKIMGRLPKEKPKAVDTFTRASPDIRNAKFSGVTRMSANAEEDQAKAPKGHYQAITAFDTDSEDEDEDLPPPVPASPGAAGPARAKRPCEWQHQAPQPAQAPRVHFRQGPERVTPQPQQAPRVSPQVAQYEEIADDILPMIRGGEMSASPNLASDDSLAIHLNFERDEDHMRDTTADMHDQREENTAAHRDEAASGPTNDNDSVFGDDQREENTAGLADTLADSWRDTNGDDSGNEADSERSDGSDEAEEEEEECSVEDDDSSWHLSSTCYTPPPSISDISVLDLGPPLLPAKYSEAELAFMNSRITTDPEAPPLPLPPLWGDVMSTDPRPLADDTNVSSTKPPARKDSLEVHKQEEQVRWETQKVQEEYRRRRRWKK